MQILIIGKSLQPPAYNDFMNYPSWLRYFLLDFNNRMNAINNAHSKEIHSKIHK